MGGGFVGWRLGKVGEGGVLGEKKKKGKKVGGTPWKVYPQVEVKVGDKNTGKGVLLHQGEGKKVPTSVLFRKVLRGGGIGQPRRSKRNTR